MHRLSLLLIVVAGACAQNGDEGILITRNVAPMASACTFTGDPSESFFSEGQWSTVASTGYLFNPQMQSRITALAGEENERTIIVEAANIDLTLDPSINVDSSLTHFKSPFSAPLPPIVGGTLTTVDGEFQLIPSQVLDAIVAANPAAASPAGATNPAFSTLIQATFTVVGKMSGEDVSSQPFTYGVTAGNNVVVQDLGACPPPNGTTVSPGNPCNVFQDGLVGCCSANGVLECPAPM